MRYIVFSAPAAYIFSPSPPPPPPGLPYATIDAVYPRDLYIFYAARTYLFFVDTRRHCCELNATRYEIPRLGFPFPRNTRYRFRSSLRPAMFQFFETFFLSFFFLFSFLKLCFLFARRNENCRSSLRTFETRLERQKRCNERISVGSNATSSYDLQFFANSTQAINDPNCAASRALYRD